MKKGLTTWISLFFPVILACQVQNGTPSSDAYHAVRKHAPDRFATALDPAIVPLVDTTFLTLFNAGSLAPFFDKLQDLREGKREKVRIVHIGDSHIQAGFQTRLMRSLFSNAFGCGGRGIIFPYRLARTNGPFDLKTFSDISWESKRNVHPNKPMESGLAGITIGTDEDTFLLKIGVDAPDSAQMDFSKFILFHNIHRDTSPFRFYSTHDSVILEQREVVEQQYYKIRPGDNLIGIARKLGTSVSRLKQWNGLRSDRIYAGKSLIYQRRVRETIPAEMESLEPIKLKHARWVPDKYSEVEFEKPVNPLFIEYEGGNQDVELYGMYAENDTAGLVYSMIGVNGARYEHYNVSARFFDQLEILDNDLVIVSLGTNESLDTDYHPDRLQEEMDLFFRNIRQRNPEARFIVCTNPDTYFRKRKTKRTRAINDAIVTYCALNGIPYWNTLSLMKGHGGMQKWYDAGFAHHDLIHFNKEGYHTMAKLLYYSIMKAYHDHAARD